MNLFCPIRKKEVAATPEEQVRASFLQFLFTHGFPKERILVEMQLNDLPHITEKVPLDRRIDILCYGEQFAPLLLIECKLKSSPSHVPQILGYNHYVGAPFIALVGSDGLALLDREGKKAPFGKFPHYKEYENKNSFDKMDFVAAHLDLAGGGLIAGDVAALARRHVKLVAVPGTGDKTEIYLPLPEWAAHVRTGVV